VIPNLGAAAHLKGAWGAAKFGIADFFDVLLHRVPKIVIFTQVEVPPNFYLTTGGLP
jgi:hypothetical protein